jgi:phenylpyruvate tautomerase PptA (4-oxalocrotonate tautomerase family)
MPYIRLYVPEISIDKKREVAQSVTDTVVQTLQMPPEARDWLTIHFVTYGGDELAVGGRLIADGATPEYYVDYIDLDVNQRIKDDLAREVTATLGRAFALEPGQLGRINFRFQGVSPDEIAMGGHFVRKLITT